MKHIVGLLMRLRNWTTPSPSRVPKWSHFRSEIAYPHGSSS